MPEQLKDVIKSWPAKFDRAHVLNVFTHTWGRLWFSLGRGKPKSGPRRLYYTHQGQIIGHFDVEAVVINDGSLPKLRSITDKVSEWQFKPDVWIAVCPQPFHPLEEKLFHEGFRGWRYFDLESYRLTEDARWRL